MPGFFRKKARKISFSRAVMQVYKQPEASLVLDFIDSAIFSFILTKCSLFLLEQNNLVLAPAKDPFDTGQFMCTNTSRFTTPNTTSKPEEHNYHYLFLLLGSFLFFYGLKFAWQVSIVRSKLDQMKESKQALKVFEKALKALNSAYSVEENSKNQFKCPILAYETKQPVFLITQYSERSQLYRVLDVYDYTQIKDWLNKIPTLPTSNLSLLSPDVHLIYLGFTYEEAQEEFTRDASGIKLINKCVDTAATLEHH